MHSWPFLQYKIYPRLPAPNHSIPPSLRFGGQAFNHSITNHPIPPSFRFGGQAFSSRHWNGDCKSCNIPSGCQSSVAAITTDPANLVYPVVSDYNILLICGNKVVNPATALSPAEQGLQSFTMSFPEDTNGIVNPTMAFPAAECPLQGSQRTRPTLFTPLYPPTTPYPAAEMGLQV